MPRRVAPAILLALSALPAHADELDRLDGKALVAYLAGPDARPIDLVGFNALGATQAVVPGTRAPLLVARTDQGNPARFLASPAFRKPTPDHDGGPEGAPVPIVVLERLETFDASDPASRVARVGELILFDGFRVDLDAGMVVPEGQGGDLQFLASGEGGPRLVPAGGATIFLPDRSPAPANPPSARPTPGRAFAPSDFAGRFRLHADGRWSGDLELAVDAQGELSGRFRSDRNGTAYPVTGRAGDEAPGLIRFAVAFPRSRQEFEGYLWGEGKGAIAGTGTLLGRTFGFFALREGARFAAEDDSAPDPDLGPDRGAGPGPIVVEVDGDSLRLDGRPIPLDGLGRAIRDRAGEDEAPRVLVRAAGSTSFERVSGILEAVRESGIGDVRLAIADGLPAP